MKLVKEYPVLSFIIFTCLWSWSIWSLMLFYISPGELLTSTNPLIFMFAALGGLGPSLVGYLLTKYIYGKEGIASLKARFTLRGIDYCWLSVLIAPTITFITPLTRSFYGHPLDFGTMKSLLIPGLIIGIVAGIIEEFGWRGFLLPQLLKRYSPLTSSLIIGLFWGGLWHGYADYLGLGNKWLLIMLLGPILLTAWSFMLTTVYMNTKGNMVMSILNHASISSSAYIFGIKYVTAQDELLWTVFSVALALLVSLSFFIIFKNKWKGK